jgi:serine/threonine protein kinase/WD40 repeat protein
MSSTSSHQPPYDDATGFPPDFGDTTAGSPPPPADPSLTELPGTTIGRYTLIEKLGEGGFGSVWAAEQREPVRRPVALKIIKLGMDTRQVVARFEAERQALALMDHPNIAKVFDGGILGEKAEGRRQKKETEGTRQSADSRLPSSSSLHTSGYGRPYFVMELVRGVPITRYCDQAGLGIRERLDLFIKVCQAIQHAHQKGIIHRDIKPSNIMVTRPDGPATAGIPKVIDFGIAKATQPDLTELTIHTQHSQFIGTPAYMSPEQAEWNPAGSKDIDTRSDIYSLGVLLYELLTGSTPFESKELMRLSLDEMRRVIREKEPVRPSTRLSQTLSARAPNGARQTARANRKSQIDPDLDWIVMKCLEKDRARRYETAIGVAADLQRYLDNEPVIARPPSTGYRLQKAFRRNKLAFSAAAAVVAALLVGLGAVSWAFVRENRAYERTRLAEQEQSRLRAEAEAAQDAAAQQRDLAQARLYETLVREARSIRMARQVGYRREVFDRLDQAIALGTPNLDASVLRREAAACLGDWVGLDPLDIEDLSVSPTADALVADGSIMALGLRRGAVSLRQTRTGRELAVLELSGIPVSLAFDQSGNALFVLLIDPGQTSEDRPRPIGLEKWSRRTEDSWTRESQRAEPGLLGLLATSTEPVALILDSTAAAITVLDLATHEDLARIPVTTRIPAIPRAAISANRQFLAFLSLEEGSRFDAQVEIWNLSNTQQVACLRPRLGPGHGLSFGSEDQLLACSFDNTLVVYETTHFNATLNLGGSFTETSGATISGLGGLLVVPSYQESAAHVIHLNSGAQLATLRLPSLPLGARFSQDGTTLLLRHQSGCRVVQLDVDHEKIRLEGHLGGVPAVEFSPDGQGLASTGKDRTVRLWELSPPYVSRVLGQLPSPGQTLVFSPNGRMLICGDYNTGGVSIWSLDTGQQLGTLAGQTNAADSTWACAIDPHGQYLAAIGNGLRVWPLADLAPSFSTALPTEGTLFTESNGVANVVFNPSGTQLAYLGMLNTERQWPSALYLRDLSPNAQPVVAATNHLGSFVQIQCFLPQSGALMYVTRDRQIAVLDPSTRTILRQFPTLEPGEDFSTYIGNIRVSPDESKVAMLSPSGLGVDIWDPANGQRLYAIPDAPGSIWWLAWSPDSQRLAVSRANGEIAVWNTGEVEAQLSRIGLAPATHPPEH